MEYPKSFIDLVAAMNMPDENWMRFYIKVEELCMKREMPFDYLCAELAKVYVRVKSLDKQLIEEFKDLTSSITKVAEEFRKWDKNRPEPNSFIDNKMAKIRGRIREKRKCYR